MQSGRCKILTLSFSAGMGIIVTEHSVSTGAFYTLQDTTQVCEFLNKLIAHGDEIGASNDSA